LSILDADKRFCFKPGTSNLLLVAEHYCCGYFKVAVGHLNEACEVLTGEDDREEEIGDLLGRFLHKRG